jgi:hypothetical protein
MTKTIAAPVNSNTIQGTSDSGDEWDQYNRSDNTNSATIAHHVTGFEDQEDCWEDSGTDYCSTLNEGNDHTDMSNDMIPTIDDVEGPPPTTNEYVDVDENTSTNCTPDDSLLQEHENILLSRGAMSLLKVCRQTKKSNWIS